MKVLFVSGANPKKWGNIPPFVKAQGDSLIEEGIDILYFPITTNGICGYIKSISKIKNFIKKNSINIIHAHYTLSAIPVILTFTKKPIILSLMGTDAYGVYVGVNKIKFWSYYLTILTYLVQPFVTKIICKSENIQNYVFLKSKSMIIPNGIKLEKFKPRKVKSVNNYHKVDKIKLLFLGNTKDIRKNYKLIRNAVEMLDEDSFELLTPYPISHSKVVDYLNNVDVLLVPSFMEGSPNLVKEAMACNCVVVATDVGDVSWLFGNEPGYFISNFDPKEYSENIKKAISFSKNKNVINGRKRIIQLGLGSENIAKKIKKIYLNVLSK